MIKKYGRHPRGSPCHTRERFRLGRWDSFLGDGPTSDTHPRLGTPDPDRIVSADGLRSIRMGAHEMGSSPTRFHYHEESWTFDSNANKWIISNLKINVPFPKGAW
jgi:hypothetical protein